MSMTVKLFQTKKSCQRGKSDFTFIDLFAGMGGIRIPFEELGGKCVFTSEFDKFAQDTYAENFAEIPSGDITTTNDQEIPPFDILLAGFPCQPFSNAGLKKGFEDTRGTLFFDIAIIVKHHKPKVFFLENVKGFKSHDKGNTFNTLKNTLEDLEYKVFTEVLNAKDFGVPQNRERIYIIAFADNDIDFKHPKPTNKKVKVGDILDKNVDDKYTISDKLWAGHQRRKKEHRKKGNGFGYSLFDDDSAYTSTMSARYYKDGSEILIKQKNKNPRKLTPKESLRLQGYPNDYVFPVSDTQAYRQCGNSVAVPVIREIAKKILKVVDF